MLANIFLTSALVVVAAVVSVSGYNYYLSILEAKQIQQTYDTVAEIKKILAKQYNKNPDEITRDELIAVLPKGKNWEKLFLSNPIDGQNMKNDSIIDENVNFVISQEDKLKLLAIKSKLKNMNELSYSTVDESNNTIKFSVSSEEKNRLDSEKLVQKEIKKLKRILFINLDSINNQDDFETIITDNFSTDIDILKNSLKLDLEKSKNSMDIMTYKKIKAYL